MKVRAKAQRGRATPMVGPKRMAMKVQRAEFARRKLEDELRVAMRNFRGMRFQADQLEALLTEMRSKRYELEKQIDAVGRWLGRDFAALEPNLVPAHRQRFEVGEFLALAQPEPTIRCEPLHLAVHADKLRRSVHVRFRLAGGEVGYAISEVALFSQPLQDLIERLTREMARMLAQNIRKDGRLDKRL